LIDKVRCVDHHGAQAEQQILDFLSRYVRARTIRRCVATRSARTALPGQLHAPLEAFFHYRNIDVSTLKELAKRWRPSCHGASRSSRSHTALADVHESIDELVYYRDNFLRLQE
jgi:oligoribonuclease